MGLTPAAGERSRMQGAPQRWWRPVQAQLFFFAGRRSGGSQSVLGWLFLPNLVLTTFLTVENPSYTAPPLYTHFFVPTRHVHSLSLQLHSDNDHCFSTTPLPYTDIRGTGCPISIAALGDCTRAHSPPASHPNTPLASSDCDSDRFLLSMHQLCILCPTI